MRGFIVKEFMLATNMAESGSPEEKLRWAFKMYDEDNSREVDKQEMENVMVVSLDSDGDCFLLLTT